MKDRRRETFNPIILDVYNIACLALCALNDCPLQRPDNPSLLMNLPFRPYWSLLTHYLSPQRARVLWLAMTLLSSIALQLIHPQLLRYFIDTVSTEGFSQALGVVAYLFIGGALLTQAFSILAAYLGGTVAWTATNALRAELVEHCLTLDLSFYQSRSAGELIERVDGDVNALSRFFSQFTIHLLGNGLLLLGILGVLCLEDWRVGLCFSLFALIALGTLLYTRAMGVPHWRAYSQIRADFFGFLSEHLAGREDLRANGAVSYVIQRFNQFLQRLLPLYYRARIASTLLWATPKGLFIVGNAIALAVGAYLWNRNAMTIGTVYMVFYYTNLLQRPLERIREELVDLQKADASILRIRELFQIYPHVQSSGSQSLPLGPLSLSCEGVAFGYEVTACRQVDELSPHAATRTSPVYALRHITFHLPPNQVLGLVGRTGSGKTTLSRLLLRLYEPQYGEIRLGDVPIAQTPLQELRQRVGLVTQDVQLFQASLRDNLTLFNSSITNEQILQALDFVGLSSWVRSLPQDLNTQLGTDGEGLSAGQAQLLAFARIFLKDPSLVILDEATSRLDPTTEALIEQSLDQLLSGRTGIIIAHRLQTLQRADQILMLEHGQIVEYGERQHLMNCYKSRFSQLLNTGSMP